jgi:hypothetical protein
MNLWADVFHGLLYDYQETFTPLLITGTTIFCGSDPIKRFLVSISQNSFFTIIQD